jgi:hypothetical protein
MNAHRIVARLSKPAAHQFEHRLTLASATIQQLFYFGHRGRRVSTILERRRIDIDVERRAAQRAVGRQHSHTGVADDPCKAFFSRAP